MPAVKTKKRRPSKALPPSPKSRPRRPGKTTSSYCISMYKGLLLAVDARAKKEKKSRSAWISEACVMALGVSKWVSGI